ncbi:hypothetical protein Cgig2_008449 [Carnegiea gigantea]|uniref:Cyclin-dependent kinase inhibitor domain-containing protein n=1 Tax=Carnegiea gigantea TaxID=171969 RepID=A0A9Q1JS40_9CARY|nr:hypothetical protein Cgig2_008449 [Carnegiea gigantea]
MGRMLGKCKGAVGEIAAVGVRTRARAALAMAEATSSVSSSPAKKIRKVSPTTTTTKYDVHELKRRRRARVAPENSASCRLEEDAVVVVQTAANCSTTGELCSDFPASCCSSNDASSSYEVVKKRLEIIPDPEAESAETSPRCFDYHRTARREKRPGVAKSDDQDSPPRRPDAKSTVQIKMPSDSEIEDFFTAAEKDLQKRFTDKYNFDIVKDVPLEGRYEWVPINP